ncbi:HDOD domain-containing protein [Bremerella sp. JC817]|uniref:sensor domain-containing diguanylate cyclase n=1 Tax=Bremerella sp. JC817 TaxID=3231756 RepID=UPI0034582F39
MAGVPSETTGDRETLDRGAELSQDPSPVAQMVARAQQLYSLPTVAMEVLKLTANEHATVVQIKECIQRDPAMTVKILKVVNSPLFGLSGEVSDLNQALALLGIKPLKLLVLGFSLPKEMLQGIEAEVLAQYWQFALTKAVAAREIANMQGKNYGDEAFIAGLLSEIGALVMLQDLGDAYANFANKVLQEEADLSEMEWETLGFDHNILGCRLLQSWNLPEALVQVIREGHPSSGIEFGRLRGQSATLRLAHNLAEVLSHHRLYLMPKFLQQLKATIDDADEQVETLVVDIQDKLYQLANVLSVSLPDGMNYCEIVSQAYLQITQLAESVAAPLAISANPNRDLVIRAPEAQSLIDSVKRLTDNGGIPPVLPKKKTKEEEAAEEGPTEAIFADARLLREISIAMQHSRSQRCEFSLALVQINRFDHFLVTAGIDEVEVWRQLVAAIVDRLSDGLGRVMPCGDSSVAIMLEDHDRHQAVTLARQVIDLVTNWSQRRESHLGVDLTLSGGVACACVPPKSLPADEIFQAAKRCILAAAKGGGNAIKSIEVL